VTKIVRGGQTDSADYISSSQATFRSQISAITDAVRQLGGNPEIGPGALLNDPLSAPYVFYVNPYTGKDTFVGGSYSTVGGATERIELQRLECGYSEARPFKTINRAIIEAGIVTAKSFYEQPLSNADLVSIVLSPGASVLLNGDGASSVSEWASGYEPDDTALQAFNPQATGGIILPRGVSLCGFDLRKTVFRPNTVPAAADELADCSNRRAIFKVTGTGYYFGFSFMDKAGSTSSHHLLDCFQFTSQSELDEFYGKIRSAFGGAGNTGGINLSLAVTNTPEYQIVGPAPAPGSQTIDTDTTDSASPYIFNCSVRSKHGICGIFADGDKASGFKSIVTAQFTGVSKQRDLSSWQKYSGGNWVSMSGDSYATYISTNPDDIRMNPSRRTFHVRAINGAFIQEVSVFAIGQGVHHWVQNGGEIISNGGFSNFGGVAGLAEGYRGTSFPTDIDWTINRIKVANNLSEITNNVKRIYLGTVAAVSASSITLSTPLSESASTAGVPELVARDGYTLRNASYVWVENPLGDDWRSPFTSSAWSTGTPSQLNITAALTDPAGNPVPVVSGDSSAIGKRVYIRRLVDTRTPAQRRYTLKLNNTNQLARSPVRDYVLQVKNGVAPIISEISTSQVLIVNNAANIRPDGVAVAAEITLRRGNASVDWQSGTRYIAGETVKRNNKHYTCIETNSDAVFDSFKWQESYAHMASSFNPEDFYKNEAPTLTFDNDTDGAQDSTNLGYNFSTVWGTDTALQTQYRAGTDYRSLHLFLVALGFSSGQAHTILTPRAEAARELNPASSGDMGGYVPSGAANAIGNWPVEFRRPSFMQLLTHNWAWSGFLNYSKSLPQYQRQLSPQNRFTYYFTNANGGRVYPTGFNEEGYQISPRGVEDLATGQTLSVEQIGASDTTLPEPQTSFESLSANNFTAGTITASGATTLNGNTAINGGLALSLTARASIAASTTQAGIVELATDGESISGTSNSVVVTPSGLAKWANAKQVAYRTTGAQAVLVGEWNGITPVVFDATYRASYWPATPGPGIDSNMPEGTMFKPFPDLYSAAAWCNEFLGTEQTAYLYMKPGFYNIAGVDFKCKIYIPGASVGTTGSFTTQNIGDYSITSPGNSVMLYNIPVVSPHYSYLDNNIFAHTGGTGYLTLRNGGTLSRVHFPSTDMILGASQISDTNFPYGAAVRTATVKSAAAGTRLAEYVRSFIAHYRSLVPTYPAIPAGITGMAGQVVQALGGTLHISECTLGARSFYGILNPGGGLPVGWIQINKATLILSGCRIRGNEFNDYTGIITGDPKVSGFHPALVGFDEGLSGLMLGGGYTTGNVVDGGPPYDRNYDQNNIHFEPTYYGADSRNGGSNPPASIIGINEANPWGAGENDATRAARGPQFTTILVLRPSSTLSCPQYSIWGQWGTPTSNTQGFKGKVGSPIPVASIINPNGAINATFQYWDTMFVEAGLGTVNIAAGSTSLLPSDSGGIPGSCYAVHTGLNIKLLNFSSAIFYNYPVTVTTNYPQFFG
jgi:hypothetical protein